VSLCESSRCWRCAITVILANSVTSHTTEVWSCKCAEVSLFGENQSILCTIQLPSDQRQDYLKPDDSRHTCVVMITYVSTKLTLTTRFIGGWKFHQIWCRSNWNLVPERQRSYNASFSVDVCPSIHVSASFIAKPHTVYRVATKCKPLTFVYNLAKYDWFSKFFHRHILWKVCNKAVLIVITVIFENLYFTR